MYCFQNSIMVWICIKQYKYIFDYYTVLILMGWFNPKLYISTLNINKKYFMPFQINLFWFYCIKALTDDEDFFLETCFFVFCDMGNPKMYLSLGPFNWQILSFFLKNQFLFCKRCLIGSASILISSHYVCLMRVP